jgi:hypothetical protein
MSMTHDLFCFCMFSAKIICIMWISISQLNVHNYIIIYSYGVIILKNKHLSYLYYI